MSDLNLDPVKKEKDIIINIENEIPEFLIGKFYLRNGGNPYIISDKNHLFDGDGMIHCLEFGKNQVMYHNRWIKTYRYKTEKKYNKELFTRLGGLNSIEIFTNFIKRFILLEDVTNTNGDGTANTNIVYHNNKLLALNEMDKPYLLDIINGKLKTIKRYDFDGKLKHNMCAHPKIDPDTKEMIVSGYDILKKMFYISFIDNKSQITNTVNIYLKGPRIIHDIGITKSKIIILDLPLEFNLTNVLMSRFPIGINRESISRIGLLDRQTNNIEWFPLEKNEIIFHIANSWEQNNDKNVIIYAFCYDIDNLDIQRLETQKPKLKRIIINTKTKKIKISKMSDYYGELPIIEDEYIGKKCNYIYYSKIEKDGFSGIIKHDIKTHKEETFNYDLGLYGGECSIYGNYIVNILYCIDSKRSKLVIHDKDTLKIINTVDLKCRVPFGFHCKIISLK